MIELRVDNCILTVLPANPSLASKLKLKTKGKSFEWQCPRCGAKNKIRINNLPYEFAGGDGWSQVMRSSAYLTQLDKICRSKRNLVSFLIEKVKLEEKLLDKNFRLRLSASARIKELCSKCGAEVTFNAELSSNTGHSLEKIEQSTFKDFDIEIESNDDYTLNRFIRGFNIYLLMEKYSLTVDLKKIDEMKIDGEQLEDLKKLLRWITSLKNDMEKTRLLDEVEMEIEKLMEAFQTDEALMYISDLLSLVKKSRDSMTKNFKRKLFLSLAQLEEHIRNITLKSH